MKPKCKITIDGAGASGELVSRLISCDVTDKEGISSDSVSLQLKNSPPAEIPRRGAKIRVWLGYEGVDLSFMGTFVVDEVEVTLFPHIMQITGKSADLREKMKENKERHWDNKKISEIVGDIADEHGLTAKVDSQVGGHQYAWFGQQDESDIHVLRRLERRHGALFSVKDDQLVFAKRGAATTSGGAPLSGIVVTPQNVIDGSARIRFADRSEYKKVTAYHQDKGKVERAEEYAGSSGAATANYRLGEPFADRAEAGRAAASKSAELKRSEISFSCSIFGDPAARAGAPLTFSQVKAQVDDIEFVIETAKHSWKKSGYTTSLDGKLKVAA